MPFATWLISESVAAAERRLLGLAQCRRDAMKHCRAEALPLPSGIDHDVTEVGAIFIDERGTDDGSHFLVFS